MSYIKFSNSNEKHYNGKMRIISDDIVEIVGLEQNLSGFGYYSDNDALIGDYFTYIYDYKQPLSENRFRYIKDESKVWKPKKCIIDFVSDGNGYLRGRTHYEVEVGRDRDYINPPIPDPKNNYKFKQWQPEIPKTRVVGDEKYTAIFEYIPTLDEIKQAKIDEMSLIQQETILKGIDVILSDKNEHKFTLTTNDQIDLLSLQLQLNNGSEKISYHEIDKATGYSKNCVYYSKEDTELILSKAIKHITFQVTYFINLANWIRVMAKKKEIEELEYGAYIPLEYQGEVMRDLYNEVGE